MKKVKILFFIYQMGGGGAARTLLNVINNLDRSIFTPYLVTLNFKGTYEEELKEDIVFLKLETTRLSKSVLKLAKIIKNEKIDLVFSTIPRVNTIAILATKLSFSKAKCVIREADNLGGSFFTNMQLRAFGFVYKFSNQIISLSEGVKENLIKRYKVKASDIKVIYNPVDLKAIQEKVENGEIQQSHKPLFDTTEKVIITAGRMVEQKDQKTLLTAFSMVEREVESRLLILGEGPLKQLLMKQAKELMIQDKVHFLGFQGNPYIYFRNSDLFVLSSKHEGFSHVIAEALATGVPVVSTNCKSGPAEVLVNGLYGKLCKVGNSDEMAENMLQILTLNEEEVVEIRERGYERAKHFDAKRIVQQYEKVFLESLKK